MTAADAPSTRASFARGLAEEIAAGRKALLLAPLGAGKTYTLMEVLKTLRAKSVPCVSIDLFTAASTPERLLLALVKAIGPFMENDTEAIDTLAAAAASDRRLSSASLLGLLDLLATKHPSRPFVWLVDEVTEIRSLAYFPELGHIEEPFSRALDASRGAFLTSSYLGLACDLFPDVDRVALPGLTAFDLTDLPSLRSDGAAIALALSLTKGSAGTLLPLVADMRHSREVTRSLAQLLQPGGALEIICRRNYEVLLLRSRGYAVSKRAAEVVAFAPAQRLTDLFPLIGRTAGASRQYLRWLVEVGLLTQIKKRYDFADPILGLWAGLYLGREDHPSLDEINGAVAELVAPVDDAGTAPGSTQPSPPSKNESARPSELVEGGQGLKRRVDRFEEID